MTSYLITHIFLVNNTNETVVLNKKVSYYTKSEDDYISLTDIAKNKNADHPADVIKNWIRSKETIRFLGLWEKINNPDFKLVEFDQFGIQAGLNSFVLPPQKWIEKTNAIGLISKVTQLVCLSNLENLNALFIKEGQNKLQRLEKLNNIAIEQMTILTKTNILKRLL